MYKFDNTYFKIYSFENTLFMKTAAKGRNL